MGADNLGNAQSTTTTLTVTNGAYSIGDVVGGLITIPKAVREKGHYALVQSVKLAGVSAINYNLWFQNADIIAGTIADNAVYNPAAADGANFLGVVPINTYVAPQSSFNNATQPGIGLLVKAAGSTTSIYAYLVATATTSPGTTTIYLTVDLFWLD